jgi:hypothetical protein
MVSILRPSQAEQVASNAWPWADGGCIFADAPNAGTSAAVILHQISMHRNRYGPPDKLRAGRAVVLRLSYRGILRRPETSCFPLASVGSTCAGTGRSGALKLANAASRIGGGFFGSDLGVTTPPSENPTADRWCCRNFSLVDRSLCCLRGPHMCHASNPTCRLAHLTSASLIGHLGSSTFRLSTAQC